MKRIGWIVCCCWAFVSLWSQTPTMVLGEVYDEERGEPLRGVEVYFLGTTYGTTTDSTGFFLLRAPLRYAGTLVVQSIGYKKEQYKVNAGSSSALHVLLKESSSELEDVFVLPGANPALSLMERVRRCRKQNDYTDGISVAKGDRKVSMSDIPSRYLRRKIWRGMESIMQQGKDSSYLLPLYTSHREGTTEESHTLVMTSEQWQLLLQDIPEQMNFYQNTVSLYSTSFLSPLAGSGNTYYRYFLADSVTEGGKAYRVDFQTKNAFYPTFNGQMWIDSLSGALCSLTATVPKETPCNYLRAMRVRVDYAQHKPTGAWIKQTEEMAMILDFAVKADSSHIFPTLVVESEMSFSPKGDSVMGNVGNTYVKTDSVGGMDTLRLRSPMLRAATYVANVILTGNLATNTLIDIGNVGNILRINEEERVRIGLPLRTNECFSKWVRLEAMAAYGIGDNAWKGYGKVQFLLPTKYRSVLDVGYRDEYVASDVGTMTLFRRENASLFPIRPFTTTIMRPLYHGSERYNTDVRQRMGYLSWENEWSNCVETYTTLCLGREGYGEPTHDYASQPAFRFTELSTTLRLSFGERKTDLFFHRIHHYNHLPTLFFNAEMGSVRMPGWESYTMYGRLRVMIRQRVSLGVGGRLDYLAEGGWVLGQLPMSRMSFFEGNESYAFDAYRFTLMHQYHYAASRYVMLHAEWNGRGCLFNLIPGVRWLRLRELVSMKVAWGELDQKNCITSTVDRRVTDLSIPYCEVGVGIGNILRVGDVYSVWRLTHRDEGGAPWWSMRFRLRIEP